MEINMQKKYDPIEILNLKKPETPGKWDLWKSRDAST